MAKSSTGPRTPRGKGRSSQNAGKHWCQSGRILPEEQQEASILRSEFEKSLEPQSLIEREMIDDLTLNRLLRRRIDVAFVRELNTAIDQKAIETREDRQRSVARYYLRLANGLGKDSADSAELAERLRPDYCIRALQGLVTRIGDRGLQPEDLNTLQAIFGDQPTEFGAVAIRLLAEAAPAQTGKDEADASTEKDEDAAATDRKELQKKILDVLKAEIKRQENRRALEIFQVATKFVLDLQEPFHHALERRMRYSSANAREFSGILDNFERIRRLQQSSATPTRADNSP